MDITFKGETLSDTEWANKTGISRAAIIHRIGRGWPVEKALTTPNNAALSTDPEKKVTKTEAERWLNELPRDKLPKSLVKHATGYKSPRHGTMIRERCIKEFNHWFENYYSRGILN